MIKMTLTRQSTDNATKAVTGTLTFPLINREEPMTYPSLENADFLIPEGTYKVERTWSPKFKKFLPEVLDVPERSGIRIHRGTIPEHSKGCILLDMNGMSRLDIMFNQEEKIYENEEVTLCIIDDFGADDRSSL